MRQSAYSLLFFNHADALGHRNIMNKAVTALATEYTYTSNVVPLVTDRRAKSPNTILYIPGEVHDQRKPGVVRFTSARERQDFIDFVVNSIQPPRPISVVAESIAGRMSGLSQGRAWIGVHLRRGDFVQINWTPCVFLTFRSGLVLNGFLQSPRRGSSSESDTRSHSTRQ